VRASVEEHVEHRHARLVREQRSGFRHTRHLSSVVTGSFGDRRRFQQLPSPNATEPEEKAVKDELKQALTERFYAVNGRHPMTPEDDEYVSEWFLPLDDLARDEGTAVDELARLMLAGYLPLPSYIRSDGTFMVARGLLSLATEAGGTDSLPQWFADQFDNARDALSAWVGYLNGQWVCLREVTPQAMRRKGELVDAIAACLDDEERTDGWRERLNSLVTELDQLEPPFAPYDRLRFSGPVSRDLYITAVREEILAAAAAAT
jgi:hypothetical protein